MSTAGTHQRHFGIRHAHVAVRRAMSRACSRCAAPPVGFCWGGGMVNEIATHADTGFLNAAVAYYGSAPAAADVPNMRVPLMLHYAGLDSRINGGMPGYTAALEAAGARATRCTCTRAPTTLSITTPMPRGTTRRRRIWPGAAPWRFSPKR